MTAGKAIELCDQMRPNNDFGDEMKQTWLRQCDARLRQTVVNRSACGDFDAVGADMAGDGLEYDTSCWHRMPSAHCTSTGCAPRWTWPWARRPER